MYMAKTSSSRTFMWCDSFFIALVIIEISLDLYIYVGSDSIETNTLTNNGKLFNEWIT